MNPGILKMLKSFDLTSEDLKRMYFNDSKISKENSEKLDDLVSDMYMVQGIHKVIKTQANLNFAPTYFYQFTYDEGCSVVKLIYNQQKRKGIYHKITIKIN